MWNKLSLRARIYTILGALVAITMVGGLVMVWYTFRMQALLTNVIDKSVAAFQVAEALETALINQKGFVSYYFLDGDPEWLKKLGEYRQIFKERLKAAHSFAETEQEKEAIRLIEAEYAQYVSLKDQVISHYKAGERETGAKLHQKVRSHFFKILDLCEKYKNFHRMRIEKVRDISYAEAKNLRIIAGSAVFTALCLAVLFAFILINHILGPLRSLAMEADRDGGSGKSGDEVKAISLRVRGLIEDVDQTHSELERSRETLIQAEKMALVGKLAAGMAHGIRNPLTSVKMRLFSLDRTLDLSATQKDDFQVISEEIRHIDFIVENFLEFSRPPKLTMQNVSPSDVVDSAIQLLRHRIKSYDVRVNLVRKRPLPRIQADPEQLKEVIVNLVVNACEAMEDGGSITIQESESFAEPLGRVAVIRLIDNGPGIPESIQEKILQPFFTTKEEGTGLGLTIAARIVEEHGGWLDLISTEGDGATFVITLPAEERSLEHDLDH